MKRWMFVCVLGMFAGLASPQVPRWRVAEMPRENPVDSIQALTEDGRFLFSREGIIYGHRSTSGQVTYAPQGFQARRILENGTVYGEYQYTAATWNVQTGSVQTMMREPHIDPTLPYYAYAGSSYGGLVAERDLGIPGGFSYSFLMSPHSPPRVIAGWQNFYGINSIRGDGTMIGFVDGPDFARAGTPAIWAPGGQTFTRLTVPGMQRGDAYFQNARNQTFGVISRSGASAGWYGVWWNADGTVFSEEKFANLNGANTSNRAYSHVEKVGPDGVVFSARRDGDTYQRTYLWSALTGVVRLESQVEGLPAGMEIMFARQATEGGRIVIPLRNSSNSMDTRWHYYLEPVPEPATLAGLALGLGWLARRRKKRPHGG